MATHDYNIANQTGADFRADLNNALLAIVSNNSNATAPSTTYAYQLWVDTANNVLKLRNSANSDWITTGISITASNSFTGDITGNSATATALATARTINGVSFDGTANISFNSDSVSEGSSNLYFTNERVDDQVNSLLTAGSGISLTYDDSAGTLTIANTNLGDITSVVAGDGLTGGGTSGDVTLAVSVDDSSIEINSDTLRVKASGITNAMLAGSIANDKLAGSIANSKLANSSVTINSQAISLGGSHTFDSDDIGEGSSNLYFTNARARATLSVGSEGSASGNGAIAYNSSTGVFTYTPPVISGLSGDTDDLSEGSSNLYYTDTRSNAAIDARVTNTFINNLSGVVADTTTALATARSIALSGDVTASGVNFDGTGDITLSTTIAANSVALGTDTTGNYVATIADAGNSRITVANSGSETAAVTLDIADDAIGTDQLANNAVALGTQSTGNYVATVTGTSNEIEVSGSGSETASVTIGLPDNVTIAGDLTVNGTTTTVNTSTLEVEDPLIKLAKANSGADSVDIGFYGLYDTSGSQDLYAGLFRDASDSGKFKLFKDLQAEPTTTVNTSGTGYAVGTLVSNLEGDVTGTVSSISNHSTSDLSEGTNLYYTNARFDTRLGTKTTDNLTEGSSNLYMTTERVQDIVGGMVTGNTETGISVTYDDADGTLDFVVATLNQDTTGNAATATALETARTIGGVSFDGTGNIDLAGVNTTGNQDTTGNAATATTAGTVTTAAQPNITSVGTLTTLTVDDITINGSTISDAGDLDIDVGGDIILNADGGDIRFRDGGTEVGTIVMDDGSNTFILKSAQSDADIKFNGNDGGSGITALTLDMSNAGRATFNENVTVGGNLEVSGADVTITSNVIHAGDTDTFFGFNDADTFRITTGGSEALRVDSSQRVGIGLSSPQGNLHVQGAAGASGGGIIYVTDADNGSTASDALHISKSGDTAFIYNRESSGDLQLGAGNTSSHVVIKSDGDVGLGTSSPTGKLNIVSGSSGSYLLNLDYNDNTDGGGFFQSGSVGLSLLLKNSSATQTVQVATEGVSYFNGGLVGIGEASPDDLLHIKGTDTSTSDTFGLRIHNASFTTNTIAGILFQNADNNNAYIRSIRSGSSNGILTFGTNTGAGIAESNISEAMRIDSSGRLLIGTTSTTPAFSTGNGHAFHVGDASHMSRSGGTTLIVNRGSDNGDIIDCRKDGTKVGSISVNDTATTFNTSSDARLKDVTGSARGLEVINELNPVAYNWKADGKADEGLIAQEVLDVVPNAVSGSEEDMYQMDYSKLVTHLVKGMQEQQEQIETLKSLIADLKGE